MSSPIEELKPYIVVYLHEDRINKYKEYYNKKNGKQPDEKEINVFIAIMISNNNIDKEAGEIAKDLCNKISSGRKTKNILINSSYTIPLCTVLFFFIFILLKKEIPAEFKAGGFYYGLLASAVILLLVTIVNAIIDFKQKK